MKKSCAIILLLIVFTFPALATIVPATHYFKKDPKTKIFLGMNSDGFNAKLSDDRQAYAKVTVARSGQFKAVYRYTHGRDWEHGSYRSTFIVRDCSGNSIATLIGPIVRLKATGTGGASKTGWNTLEMVIPEKDRLRPCSLDYIHEAYNATGNSVLDHIKYIGEMAELACNDRNLVKLCKKVAECIKDPDSKACKNDEK